MQTAQYWKPGETRPRGGGGDSEPGEVRRGSGSGGSSSVTAGDSRRGSTGRRKRDTSRGDHAERRNNNSNNNNSGNSSGSAKKREKKGKGRDAQSSRIGGIDAQVSRAAPKSPVAGPSQGLLAMKFMQRKVKADEAEKQQQDRRRDFSSSYAKRLKTNKAGKDRLICREDEQDPALVVVGRRSFGGFNIVAEAAYDACVRDMAAGQRLGQPGHEADGGSAGEISDTEMAETLWKNVRRHGGRR